MERLCYIAILGFFEFLVNGQSLQSPCPGVFEYQSDKRNIYGMIRIPSDGPVTAVTTRVNFTVATRLTSKYMGRLEPIGTHDILLLFNQGAPLTYRVYFPVTSPLPRLTSLTFNDTLICYGPGDVVGPTQDVSRLSLQHILYLHSDEQIFNSFPEEPKEEEYEANVPNNENTQGNYDTQHDSRSEYDARTQPTPPQEITPSAPLPKAPNFTPVANCGVTNNVQRLPLIHRGFSYERGDYPWAVAIYKRKDGLLQLICVGSLITDNHVITAAHCLQTISGRNEFKDIVIKIGVYNVEDWGEEFTITRTVKTARIHDYYNATLLSNDIAILEFTRPVEFNDYIKPVCLWSGNPNLNHIVGASGVVVGWGPEQGTPFGEPRMVRMSVVSTAQCRSSRVDFHKLTSDKTLCAGNRDGSGPCLGDSGGGLYILDGGRWKLRGVISLSLRSPDGTISCNLQEYIVFVDVAKYINWIQSTIQYLTSL